MTPGKPVTRKELKLLYPGKSEAWYDGWLLADMDLTLGKYTLPNEKAQIIIRSES